MKANELLRTLILATVLLISFAASAQDGEDVTSLYIINAGFDEDLTFQADGTKKAAINTETSLSDRSWAYITEDSTVYARPKDSSSQQRPDGRKAEAVNGFIGWIKGWKPITNQDYPMCEWIYYGAVPYSIGADAVPISDDSNTFLTAPDKLPAYNTEDNIGVLYLRSGWGNQCNYQQTTTLPKGSYQLEYWTININSSSSAEAEDITNVSFKDESTEVVFKDDSGTAFSSHEWVKHSISFSLKEATECTLTFGFKAANAGSNANPWICIDGVKLIATDSSSTTPEIITFADAKVKEICVANWDTDGDGELSYDEAAAVTDISQAFWTNDDITTFDELQYFTGLQSSGQWTFYKDTQLTSIKLPINLTIIDNYSFCRCESLPILEIPQNVTSIGVDAIKGCTSLKEIVVPSGFKTFATSALAECSNLESVQFSNSVTGIGDHAFHGCSSLTSIIIPSSVETLGEAPFVYCNSLESISVDAGNMHFDSRNNCNAVIRTQDNALIIGCKNTVIPSTVTKIELGAFAGHSGLKSIVLNEDIYEIGDEAFAGCTTLSEIRSQIRNPFAINANVFTDVPDTAVLFVPNDTKTLYEATDGWKDFPGRIEEMEPEDSTIIAINEENFPDENLRNWLLQQEYGSDGELTAEEIAAVTEIDVSEKDIQSLKGIEYFTALTKLVCSYNQLTDLDVSKNTALKWLQFDRNQLTTLDVSKNTALTWLDCLENKMTALDVSQNTALDHLICCANQLTTLDVSQNTALTYMRCMANKLTTLDVSHNTSLNWLDCDYNQLTTLDISQNTALSWLNCRGNKLTTLDVSQNTSLNDLLCAAQESEQNRLLYVADKTYGNFDVGGWNIIRGGQAEEIVLVDNEPLYIPEPFTAQHISYTHNFSKETQRGVASGWESLVLPFDVQSISCDSVEIVPFGANAVGYSKFWLAEVNPETGFTAATSIEANKPYILAMPNSTEYGSGNITGSVTFSATNVTVQPTSNEKTECAAFALTPCWSLINDTDSTYNEIYVLNDSTYTAPNQTVYPAGSVFVRSLRPVRPFEAYYTPANGAGVKEFFPINEVTTGIESPTQWSMFNDKCSMYNEAGAVYDLSGRKTSISSVLPKGLYIQNGHKIMVK